METVTVNLATSGHRKETLNGRDYLVVPVTTLVPGVLNGSDGPLLYRPEEVGKNPHSWNGMPIVVYHPTHNGQPVSARDPVILEKYGVGELYRSSYAGKLQHEAWFEESRVKKVDTRVHNAILSGTPLEVSTGLYLDTTDAPEGSTWLTANGEKVPYIKETSNYQPDHLAVLPDQVGACSIKQGCGIFINESTATVQYLGTDGKPLADSQKPSVWNKFKEWFGLAPSANQLSYEQVREQLRQAMRSRFMQSEPHCYIVEVYPDYFIYEHDEKYYKLDYTQSGNSVTLGTSPVEVVRAVSYEPATLNSEESMTKLTDNQRNDLVTFITTNCDCWKGEQEALSKMSDAQLSKIKVAVENSKKQSDLLTAVKKGFTDPGGNEYTWNEEKAGWEPKPKPSPVLVGNQQPALAAPPTLDAWLASAPPEVRATITNLLGNEAKTREEYITRLTANVQSDEVKAARRKSYESMSTDQLKALADDFAPASSAGNPWPFAWPPANYSGAAGAPQGVTGNKNGVEEDDVLVAPTLNYDEKELRRGRYHDRYKEGMEE